MIHFVLPIVIGLAPAGPPEIPIEVTPAVRDRGIVDASHLAEIRAKLARMVCPDDLPKVRVSIHSDVVQVVAVAYLPTRRSPTYVFQRTIRLEASDWDEPVRWRPRKPRPRRWEVERRTDVLRSFNISGTIVEMPLDATMTYDETRDVLWAIREGRIALAAGVTTNNRPTLATVCRIKRSGGGDLSIATRHPTERWHGDAYVGKMIDGRFVVSMLMAWCSG